MAKITSIPTAPPDVVADLAASMGISEADAMQILAGGLSLGAAMSRVDGDRTTSDTSPTAGASKSSSSRLRGGLDRLSRNVADQPQQPLPFQSERGGTPYKKNPLAALANAATDFMNAQRSIGAGKVAREEREEARAIRTEEREFRRAAEGRAAAAEARAKTAFENDQTDRPTAKARATGNFVKPFLDQWNALPEEEKAKHRLAGHGFEDAQPLLASSKPDEIDMGMDIVSNWMDPDADLRRQVLIRQRTAAELDLEFLRDRQTHGGMTTAERADNLLKFTEYSRRVVSELNDLTTLRGVVDRYEQVKRKTDEQRDNAAKAGIKPEDDPRLAILTAELEGIDLPKLRDIPTDTASLDKAIVALQKSYNETLASMKNLLGDDYSKFNPYDVATPTTTDKTTDAMKWLQDKLNAIRGGSEGSNLPQPPLGIPNPETANYPLSWSSIRDSLTANPLNPAGQIINGLGMATDVVALNTAGIYYAYLSTGGHKHDPATHARRVDILSVLHARHPDWDEAKLLNQANKALAYEWALTATGPALDSITPGKSFFADLLHPEGARKPANQPSR